MKDPEEIICYEYRGSKKRRHMSNGERAAQFAPFSALSGYEDAIGEEERLTLPCPVLEENEKEEINGKLVFLIQHKNRKAEFTYFAKDRIKDGGCFKTIEGSICKYDNLLSVIVLDNSFKLKTEDIISVKIEME